MIYYFVDTDVVTFRGRPRTSLPTLLSAALRHIGHKLHCPADVDVCAHSTVNSESITCSSSLAVNAVHRPQDSEEYTFIMNALKLTVFMLVLIVALAMLTDAGPKHCLKRCSKRCKYGCCTCRVTRNWYGNSRRREVCCRCRCARRGLAKCYEYIKYHSKRQ
ncbi:hypothetical protein LSAT2_003948 [Lamellibrachia satsuma]|nr:hypothetical protein LSAT2_003948 [Lamellibrachia satsuma]